MTTTDRLATMRIMATKQPDNPLARFGLANELLKVGLLHEAVAELSAYLSLYDDEGNGWLRYADALQKLGRADDASAAIVSGIAAAKRYGHAALVTEFEALADQT